jgi:hypothetical protein
MADLRLQQSDASAIEKNNSSALAFHNNDVKTLSWEDLSVKVTDRATGADKYILSAVSGHVQAGTSQQSASHAVHFLWYQTLTA